MSIHSSILAWRIHGQRHLEGYSPWGQKESHTAERLTLSLSHNNVSLTARVKNLKKNAITSIKILQL